MNTATTVIEVGPSNIMMEVFIYFVVSIALLFLMDWYAAKKIGNKRNWGYRALKPYKALALLIIGGFSLAILLLCMYKDLTVSRYTLTYFGLPYFISVFYFMITMLRRVRAETKGRQL